MEFKPLVAPEKKMRELTVRACILGILLGLIFCVSNAYLALKVGTTVTASIPAAVLSMAILKLFKKSTILENNIVQTIATVGEALAAGAVFTVPAFFVLDAPIPISQIFILSLLGGILGILLMIPMRRHIIVQEHGKLPFPEGVACAAILEHGSKSGSKALQAGVGFLVGIIYKVSSGIFYAWNETVTFASSSFQKLQLSVDCTPALLGVGFIVGPRISSLVFAGGVVAWWVLIPIIGQFGTGDQLVFPGTIPIGQMSADQIWSNYIRYIGVGAIAVGGLLNLSKIFPFITKILKVGFKELLQASSDSSTPRTDRDISLRYLILGSVAILLVLYLFPGLSIGLLPLLLLIILSFFFVALTSITVGIVGSTSNPVSGMTITTLLIISLVFLSLGWTERFYMLTALTVGVVVNTTICLAATTSQDLKTGFLLGATPKLQQIGELLGLVIPALALGGTIYLLNEAYHFGSSLMPAPQGMMMALIVKGVLQGQLPMALVLAGAVLGLVMQLLRIPCLPFALGLYLPFSLTSAMMVGGAIAAAVDLFSKKIPEAKSRGTLIASGLIAGDACIGVVIALLAVTGWIPVDKAGWLPNIFSFSLYLLLAVGLGVLAMRPPKKLA